MRILIYRLGSLGDTVVALPCFRRIRNAYPQAQITVLTNMPISGKAAPLETILEHTGLIDDVIPYPIGLRDPRALAELRDTIASRKFDLLISLTAPRGLAASIRDYFFFRACGIRKIIGIPWRRRDLTCLANNGLYENEADRLWRRVRTLPTVASDDQGLGLTESESVEARNFLQKAGISSPFIVVSVGTKLPFNNWGIKNWEKLLAALSPNYPSLGLVLIGSADEIEQSDNLTRTWTGPTANFCGKTFPRVSAAILHEARLFIGHDSGPMHLAAAAGTRCVTVYSAHTRPGQWFPRGSGHINLYPWSFFDPRLLDDSDYQHRAIASIPFEAVLDAVKSCLSSTGSNTIGGT